MYKLVTVRKTRTAHFVGRGLLDGLVCAANWLGAADGGGLSDVG